MQLNLFKIKLIEIKRRLIYMSTEDRANATVKNIEGKAQEAMGEMTGNPEDKAAGKVKQTEAKAQHTLENAKDKVKQAID
jgi:uncharacterized protein YjbJ (UPF0337 family)